jgi:hypothetical protein
MKTELNAINVNLSNLHLDDVEVLFEHGGQGMPSFAASSGKYCNAPGACSSSADVEN